MAKNISQEWNTKESKRGEIIPLIWAIFLDEKMCVKTRFVNDGGGI